MATVKTTERVEVEVPIPHSPEAEEGLLGALLVDRDTVVKVAATIKPDDFFSVERGNVYRAILNLYQQGVPADALTVADELKRHGHMGAGDGKVTGGYLAKLMLSTRAPIYAPHYAQIVLRHSLNRELIQLGADTAALGYEDKSEVGDKADRVNRGLMKLVARMNGQNPDYYQPHEEAITYSEKVITRGEELEKLAASGPNHDRPALAFGWKELDGQDWTHPPTMLLLPSTMTGIMADTGVGKTTVAQQIADYNAERGAHVAYFHPELSHDQMNQRRFTRLSGVPIYKQLRPQTLTDHERTELLKASDQIYSWKGRVDYYHCPGWHGERIIEVAKAQDAILGAKKRRGYDLIIIDYLQRTAPAPHLKSAERRIYLSHNCQVFSDLANELDCAVIVLSQVKRKDGTGRGNGGDGTDGGFVRPDLHDALETGDFERYCNQVLGVWRDDENAEFLGLKSTFGEAGWKRLLVFDKKRFKYD